MTKMLWVLYWGSLVQINANAFVRPGKGSITLEEVIGGHSVQTNWGELEVASTHEMSLTCWQPHLVQRARKGQYCLLDGSIVVYDGIGAHVVVSRLYNIVIDED